MTSGAASRSICQLGFGGASLARTPGSDGDAEAAAALGAAIEAGVTHFDTAPFYGHGLSEARLGAALRWLDRDRITVSTKVGFRLKPGSPGQENARKAWGATLPFAAAPDFSFEGALASFEQSEARLGLGQLDIAFLHGLGLEPDSIEAASQGAFPALVAAKSQGRVKQIGIAVNSAQVGVDLLRTASPDIVMVAGGLSLADASAVKTLMPLCQQRGIKVWAAAPFAGGILSGNDSSSAVASLKRHCHVHGIQLLAAALQFPLQFEGVSRVLVGLRTSAQVHAAMAAMNQTIEPAFWKRSIPLPELGGTQPTDRMQTKKDRIK